MTRSRLLRALALIPAVAFLVPASAGAAVTSTGTLTSEGVSITALGDAADDRLAVACGSDGNVDVNGLDPGSESDPDVSTPVTCADVTTIAVDGGAGDDVINLRGVQPEWGFSNADLCGPCAGGGYAIVAECVAGQGDDTIHASTIGTLIGGCQGVRSMAGDDLVKGSIGDDAIAAGPGEDEIRDYGGDNQLFGGPDDDFVVAGVGDDLVVGKQGDDVLAAGDGDDRVAGGPGFDAMRGGKGTDSCVGGPDGATSRGCESVRGVVRRLAAAL